ncbi:MAG: MerR family transcriptional regulator [Acidobacteria bacterium]|nr:MerR family transcriptional regulator [Acidobacteriota bacterium]
MMIQVDTMVKAKVFSTRQAAEKVGIGRITLERWIRDGKVEPPRALFRNSVRARFWTAEDIERLRKAKRQFYRKGSGRKPEARK